jgi:NAD(P)-dependent dehydrogenase (short-subunit alcohol dehydrogenase family)
MVKVFYQNHQKLDVLLNTAAVFLNRRIETPDRLETMFATNHLGPFLLTNLLIRSLEAATPSRVITVTAPSTTKLDFEDLQGTKHFGALNAFGATKTANLLFTYELARKLTGFGVTANALHPGLVRSNLMHEAPFIIKWLARLTSKSPNRAAEALVYLSSSPAVKEITGKFFKGMKISESSSYSNNPENQKRLWEISAALTRIETR